MALESVTAIGIMDNAPGPTRVLMVDDDKKLCRLVGDYLAPMGYDVTAAFEGPAALQMILDGDFHVVILDVMLPEMDGFELLARIRRQSDIPVLMLTARGEETDRIVGLEMGADDYLPKTFSTRELLARLRAVTRRRFRCEPGSSPRPANDLLIQGELVIDPGAREARLGAKALCLTALEFDLLACLAKAAGRVLSRAQLLDAVTGRRHDVFDRAVDVHISSLRRKLGDDPRNPRLIRTVRSVGYMFNSHCAGDAP